MAAILGVTAMFWHGKLHYLSQIMKTYTEENFNEPTSNAFYMTSKFYYCGAYV